MKGYKTIAFNVLALATFVAVQFGFGEFEPTIPVEEIGAFVVLVVNIILRLTTSTPVFKK